MLDWQDYYEQMNAKGRRVAISDALSGFKAEHEAFNEAWAAAEARGDLNGSVWGDGDEVEDD